MKTQRFTTLALAAAASLFMAGAAHAQSAGSLMIRAGVTEIKPNVDSGDLTAPS